MDKLINTTWKLTGDIGLYNCDAMAVTFLDEGYFQYIKILDGKQVDDLYGGPNTQYTWRIEDGSLYLSFSVNDYTVLRGEIDSKKMTMKGNKYTQGECMDDWFGEQMDLETFISDSEECIKKELEETESIKIIDILIKIYGKNLLTEDTPEDETISHKIRESKYMTLVSGAYANEIKEDDQYSQNDEIEVEICAENYLGHFFREDLFCHFEIEKLNEKLPSIFSKDEIEEWINNSLSNALSSFNNIIVADLDDDNELYLEIPKQQEVHLEDLNPEWTQDSYVLDGENPYEDQGRLNQLKYG